MKARACALLALLLAALIAAAPSALGQRTTEIRGATAPAAEAPKPEAQKLAATLTMTEAFAALDTGTTCNAAPDDAAYVFVSIKNEGTVPLVARSAKLFAPADLQLCPAVSGKTAARAADGTVAVPPQTIAPDRSIVLPLQLAVKDGRPPRPGTVPLVIELHVTRADDTGGGDYKLVSDKVDLQVPGLTDALKLFGVPTLLLLPGALVLGAIGLRYTDKEAQWLTPSSATFWIVSILISLGIALVYGLIANRWGHNLVDRYDLRDVGIIWGLSVAGGTAWGAGLKWQRDKTNAAIAARVPQQGDTPRELLGRLKALNKKLVNDWYVSAPAGAKGFLLSGTGLEKRWLIPRMTCVPPAGVTPEQRAAVLKAFDEAGAGPLLDPAKFLKAIDTAEPGVTLDLGWEDGAVFEALDAEGLSTNSKKTFTTR